MGWINNLKITVDCHQTTPFVSEDEEIVKQSVIKEIHNLLGTQEYYNYRVK